MSFQLASVSFSRWVFRAAGIFGLAVIGPLYFLEGKIGQDYPPAINHPEYFYGFVGVTLAWQVAFLVIGQDPRRFRPLMLPAVIEKFSFGIAAWMLWFSGRIPGIICGFATGDLVLGVLFVWAFFALRE